MAGLSPNLRKRILLPLILVFLGLALTFIFTFHYEEKRYLNEIKEVNLASVQTYYDSNILARTEKLKLLAESVVDSAEIRQLLQNGDRDALYQTLESRYLEYRQRWQVTHFYFHTTQGVNLLRIHKRDRYGDKIDRFTMKQALATGEIASGVELGVLGTLTLRMVMPVYLADELVGYIELGEEVADLYETIASILDVSIFLLVDEKLVTTEKERIAPAFIDGKPEWGVMPNQVVYHFCGCEMPSYVKRKLIETVQDPAQKIQFEYTGTHLLSIVPLYDVARNSIGRMVVDTDVSEIINESRRLVTLISMVAILVWVVISIFFYLILKHFEKDLHDSKQDLIKKDAALLTAQHMANLSGWLWNQGGREISLSSEFCQLLAVDEESSPKSFEELIEYIHEHDRAAFSDYFRNVIIGKEVGDIVHRLIDRHGKEKWIRHKAKLICTIEDKEELIQAVAQDVTEQQLAERQAMRLAHVLKYSWNEIYLFDKETLLFTDVSEGALKNLGYSLKEIQQLTPYDIKPEYSKDQFRELIAPLRFGTQKQLMFETVHKRKDGSRYPVEVRLQYSEDIFPPAYMAIIQDISERQHYINELERKALYDDMTGLPNRCLFSDKVAGYIKQSKRMNQPFAVVLLDIRRLKEVNDTLSFEIGNKIIKQVAEILSKTLRESDVVARLGGGEFAMLLPLSVNQDLNGLLDKIANSLQTPLIIDEMAIDVDVSLGAGIYPQHGDHVSTLIRNADMALQYAKTEQIRRFIYNEEHHPFSVRGLKLTAELRVAINNGEIDVYYQPKASCSNGEIIAVEALARWPRSDGEWVGPAEFVPLAERTGMIHPLTMLVLEKAIRQCGKWREQGINLVVAINLSARNLLDTGLADAISNLMREVNVSPDRIMLEVTETAVMSNPEGCYEVLNQLNSLGIKIAIDDYGTGYSSLAYLKRLPVQELKIDQSFVREMLTSTDDAIIVRSTIELAHNMGLSVVAEGVENLQVWAALREMGCDVIQGYCISRPVPHDVFEAWHADHQGRVDISSGRDKI